MVTVHAGVLDKKYPITQDKELERAEEVSVLEALNSVQQVIERFAFILEPFTVSLLCYTAPYPTHLSLFSTTPDINHGTNIIIFHLASAKV